MGKVLGKLFKTANNSAAPIDLKEKSEALSEVINQIQEKVDTEFSARLDALLPALKIFGYPGLADPKLSTETTLNIGNILDSHTKIRYGQGDGLFLPETYNGLGSRNLIYILFQLFEFFRDWQSRPISNDLYLIFIEEPEAHLHPQMQQVFINQLNLISSEFSQTLNNGNIWPVQFIVTTHSTHIANEAKFESIRYFLTTRNEQAETKIKDLRKEFSAAELVADKEFLHKYLTLTRCDLFFADKAMLIEGPTERILMPVLVDKVDQSLPPDAKLKGQYLTVIEVGGAYAHHFYKFLDFLELRTLIITDIDAVEETNNGKITYLKSCVAEGSHTSNAGIKHWFDKDHSGHYPLKQCLEKTSEEKISGCRRIAYQIPEKSIKACARSFEDAFILANTELFGLIGESDDEIALNAYEMAKSIEKTNFALKYGIDEVNWNPPLYIVEGLEWLSHHPNIMAKEVQEEIANLVEEVNHGTSAR